MEDSPCGEDSALQPTAWWAWLDPNAQLQTFLIAAMYLWIAFTNIWALPQHGLLFQGIHSAWSVMCAYAASILFAKEAMRTVSGKSGPANRLWIPSQTLRAPCLTSAAGVQPNGHPCARDRLRTLACPRYRAPLRPLPWLCTLL